MNKQDEEDYNFTDSSTVNNNLDNCVKKHKKDNLTSPVFIQSYGSNNFIIESINDIQNKTNDRYDNMYCSYDDNEFKRNKNYKSNTTSTIISPKKNNTFFDSKKIKPVLNYYKDYTNTEIGYDYVDNNFILNNNEKQKDDNKNIIYDTISSYPLYTKEDVDELFYPSEKSDLIINKRPNLIKHQKSSTAFISKNKLKKRIKKKKNILSNNRHNNIDINEDICKNIKTEIIEDKKKSSFSISKNQLNEFNIDKLIEIGDNFALKCFNKIYKQNKLKNGINKNDDISDKKDKQNNLINKMLIIEEKRKNSVNKLNTISKSNRINITSRINSNININDLDNNRENENKTQIKDINDTYYYNYEPNSKNKVIKINSLTREAQIKNKSKINLKKIKKNSIIIPNKYKIKTFNSYKEFKRNHINLGSLTSKHIFINKDMKLFSNQISNKIIDKKIFDIPKDLNSKTINCKNKIIYNNFLKNKVNINNDNKASNINRDSDMLKKENNNHSFLERVNVNPNKRVIKIHNSFNNKEDK